MNVSKEKLLGRSSGSHRPNPNRVNKRSLLASSTGNSIAANGRPSSEQEVRISLIVSNSELRETRQILSLIKPLLDTHKLSQRFSIGDITFATTFPTEYRRAIEQRHNLPIDCWAKVDFSCLGSAHLVLRLAKRNYGDLRMINVQKFHKVWLKDKNVEEGQSSTAIVPTPIATTAVAPAAATTTLTSADIDNIFDLFSKMEVDDNNDPTIEELVAATGCLQLGQTDSSANEHIISD